MKKYLLLNLISLAYFSGKAQTTFNYSGTSNYDYYGSASKISVIAQNNNNNPLTNQMGLLGVTVNASSNNYGIVGTTKSIGFVNTLLSVGVMGDNASNNLNFDYGLAIGGIFKAKNAGISSSVIGVNAQATGLNNSTVTYGVQASAINTSNTTAQKTIAVQGITTSGNTTTSNYLFAPTNPGGYFTGNDGQGLYATTTGGYNYNSSSQKNSQAVTGYSNQASAYLNAGIVGYAEGTGNFKFGVFGYLQGTAGTNNSAAIIGSDNINATNTYAGYFLGKVYMSANLNVAGNFNATGTKNFMIDHPLDPENKILRHAAMESNEVLNQYSGNITTDASGFATVTLPNYFETLNKDFRYQLTAIGSFSAIIIKKKISNNQFTIQSEQPKVEVSWQITGVRNDRNMQYKPFVAESEKAESEKGVYLSPEAYGIDQKKNIETGEIPLNKNQAKIVGEK